MSTSPFENIQHIPDRPFAHRFKILLGRVEPHNVEKLAKYGIISENRTLTENGLILVRSLSLAKAIYYS
jgi:hypothetical protein